jgi:hypothetical protein
MGCSYENTEVLKASWCAHVSGGPSFYTDDVIIIIIIIIIMCYGILLSRVVISDWCLCKEIVDTTELEVFNKATCSDLAGQHQANTCDVRHKREIQIALLFGNWGYVTYFEPLFMFTLKT